MINNRQAGRRRGRGGQRPQGNPGRSGAESGNRIDNRARGNASQLHEKYKTLARDSQMQGDRVTTEYYLQFADHYFRVLAETRARFDENRRQNGEQFDDDDDEFAAIAAANEGSDSDGDRPRVRQDNNRQDSNRQDSNRQDGNRQDRQDGYRDGNRHEGRQDGRNDSRQDARPDNRQDTRPDRDRQEPRGDRNRYRDRQDTGPERDRADQGARTNGRANGHDRNEQAPPPEVQQAAPVPPLQTEDEAPRRRGRPRRETYDSPVEATAMIVEAEAGIDAERLPPSLAVGDVGEEKPKPRRGRPPKLREAEAGPAAE